MDEENKKEETQNGQAKLLEEGEKHDLIEGAVKTKREYYIELALFLILGILIGIAVKTEAAKRITIGYNDYKMSIKKQDYDINKLQTDLTKKAMEEAQKQSEEGVPAENGGAAEEGTEAAPQSQQ